MFEDLFKKAAHKYSLDIGGMKCEHCAAKVAELLKKIPGIEKVVPSVAEGRIDIVSSVPVVKELVEKAVKEAEQYAAEDAKIKEKVEVRNQADQMVYQSEKTLGEVGDKIPADEKSKVQAGIDKLKETLKGDDTDAIKAATEELTQLFYAMSEKLYQQANPQGAQGAGPDMGGAQGGAQTGPDGQQYYDADYKVVDDDENKK